MEQEETRSKQLSTYIQSSPSDYQRKTRRKWSPEPQSRSIQRNPRRIKTSHKKSPVWRRIQSLNSLPGLPTAVALSIIGTILAIWKKIIFCKNRTKIFIIEDIISRSKLSPFTNIYNLPHSNSLSNGVIKCVWFAGHAALILSLEWFLPLISYQNMNWGFCWNERQNCQITVFIVLPSDFLKEDKRPVILT